MKNNSLNDILYWYKFGDDELSFVNAAKIRSGMEEYGELPSEKQMIKSTVSVAWPSVLESFSICLAGTLDTIMVGSLGASSIAAVGLTNQPKFLVLAFFLALNVSVSSIVARRRGEGNKESANRVLRMALIITVIGTIILSGIAIIFADPIIRFVGSQPDTHDDAVSYFSIILMGIIFNTVSMVINAAQKGAGNTRISMITNIISNVVNVIFNYLLIGGNFGFPALGIKGAAIATVIGAACACVLSIKSIFNPEGFIYFRSVKGFLADKLSRKSMVNVGSSALVEQLCMRVGFLLFAITIANLGTIELASHQIGMSMMSMSFSIGDGFSVAAVTLIGQNLGRKRPDLAKIYGSLCQKIGLILAFVISAVYIIFGREIFGLFTDEQAVLDYGVAIMRILSVILFLQIEQVVQFGCLRGAGDTKFTALISLISVAILRPGLSFLLCYPLGLGLIGAWIGTACDQLVRFTLSFMRFRKGNWVKLKL